jgi:uncharacterized protein YqiB (DUF1249 family)
MVTFRNPNRQLQRPRLGRLQQAQEEIYRQLQLLLPDEVASHDRFVSRISGSPDLHLEILERHAYTHFLRLTYRFDKPDERRLAPDAHLRVYHDASIAEVTAFNSEQGFTRSAHPWYPALPLVQRAWRENLALDKWLGYLLGQGHSFETMRPTRTSVADGINYRHSVTVT